MSRFGSSEVAHNSLSGRQGFNAWSVGQPLDRQAWRKTGKYSLPLEASLAPGGTGGGWLGLRSPSDVSLAESWVEGTEKCPATFPSAGETPEFTQQPWRVQGELEEQSSLFCLQKYFTRRSG